MITTVSGIRKIISDTWTDPNELAGPAMVYIAALDEAERMYGAKGVKSLISLIATNLHARTREQKEVKKDLLFLARR